MKTALFLGGGAPNLTLMSGALLALHRGGYKDFDIISMAGAGAVVGLAYLAPKGGLTPEQALANTVNLGISDEIYGMFPVNYKAFGKPGPSAEAFNDWWFSQPAVRKATHQFEMTDMEKLWADWLLFVGAMMCPMDLSFFSKGISGHSRFIRELIDFKELKRKFRRRRGNAGTAVPRIEINAFDIGAHKIRDFKSSEQSIDLEHLQAALSFPFIHAPKEIDGRQYYEGAAFQTLNDIDHAEGIDRFIVLNPLKPNLIRAPDDLWDAYTQSIIMPVTAIAEGQVKEWKRPRAPSKPASWIYYRAALQQLMTIFMEALTTGESLSSNAKLERLAKQQWYFADLQVPDHRVDAALGWRRSSLKYLFDEGKKRGKELVKDLDDEKPDFSPREAFRQVFDMFEQFEQLKAGSRNRPSRGTSARSRSGAGGKSRRGARRAR
jgi:hypothetical protein